ncbi:MAG: serine/threonine protein phosphatase, partial [Candidatus Micrarchaeaceae archaeon]
MVARGEITQEEAYAHPKRNVITRCLGMQQEIEVQMLTQELKFGNSLIICSDGLWEMVRDTEIKAVILGTPDLQAASQQLVDLANKNGGKDNITVI